VKRFDRDESVWVVIHMYMEAMLGIPLYSYPYVKLAKCYAFLIIAYVFSSTKLEKRADQDLPGNEVGREEKDEAGGKGERWLKQCMHI
jgi:hypothetical protein